MKLVKGELLWLRSKINEIIRDAGTPRDYYYARKLKKKIVSELREDEMNES